MRALGVRTVAFLASLAGAASADAQGAVAPRGGAKPTIVLVHGAFADASGWQDVIPLLQRDGYTVVAVQNALTSLVADVATTRRVIDAQAGPVVAVGHSYGGAVISAAASGAAQVTALVYIAAFAPDAGEPIGAFVERYPSDLGSAVVRDAAGYLYIDTAKYRAVFAADVPERQTRVMATAQKAIVGTIFGQSAPTAAWKSIPSWYIVAQQDRSINPELERFYAKRMKARTTEIPSSHLPFVSHPREVARVIVEAAGGGRR